MRLVLPSLALAATTAFSGCGMFQQGQPYEAKVTLHVAEAAMAAGVPEMALRVAEMMLQRQPHNVAAMVARADALYALGEVDAARTAYREAVAAAPANPGALIGLGRTLVRANPAAAAAAFEAALVEQPHNVLALNNLGIARDMQGDHPGAQEAYRRALAVSPKSLDVQTNLGLSLALSGDGTKAVKMLEPIATAAAATPMQRANLAVAEATVAMPFGRAEASAAGAGDASPLAISVAPRGFVRREALGQEAVLVAEAQSVAPALRTRVEPVSGFVVKARMEPAGPVVKARVEPVSVPVVAAGAAPVAGPVVTAGAAPVAGPVAKARVEPVAGPVVKARVEPVAAPVLTARTEPARSGSKVGAPAQAGPASIMRVDPATVVAEAGAVDPVRRLQSAFLDVPAPPAAIDVPLAAPRRPDVRLRMLTKVAEPVPGANSAATGVAANAYRRVDRQVARVAEPAAASSALAHRAEMPPSRDHTDVLSQKSTPRLVLASAAAPSVVRERRGVVAGYSVQVCAADLAQAAGSEWQKMRSRWPDLLSGQTPAVQQASVRDQTFWRLRTGTFTNVVDAGDFCARLRAVGSNCWISRD